MRAIDRRTLRSLVMEEMSRSLNEDEITCVVGEPHPSHPNSVVTNTNCNFNPAPGYVWEYPEDQDNFTIVTDPGWAPDVPKEFTDYTQGIHDPGGDQIRLADLSDTKKADIKVIADSFATWFRMAQTIPHKSGVKFNVKEAWWSFFPDDLVSQMADHAKKMNFKKVGQNFPSHKSGLGKVLTRKKD